MPIGMDIEELTHRIKTFSLEDCSGTPHVYRRVLLQLFGYLGHGKSSFINSCKFVLDGEKYENLAKADNSDQGRTTVRISYPLTDNIVLVDNRGCGKMNCYETGEIYAQLANLLPLDTPVEWSRGFQLVHRIVDAETDALKSDFIFPVFLYSVKMGVNEEDTEALKNLLLTAKLITGIFPFVVLTYKAHGGLTKVENTFRDMGADNIFPLENYTEEDHHKTRGRHEDVLRFFHEITKEVEFRLNQEKDPTPELKIRKEFVLKFVYDYEMRSRNSQKQAKREGEEVYQEIKRSSKDMKAAMEREAERKEFDEYIKQLEEKYEALMASDALRFREEMRRFQRDLERMKKKRDVCSLQ